MADLTPHKIHKVFRKRLANRFHNGNHNLEFII